MGGLAADSRYENFSYSACLDVELCMSAGVSAVSRRCRGQYSGAVDAVCAKVRLPSGVYATFRYTGHPAGLVLSPENDSQYVGSGQGNPPVRSEERRVGEE